MKVGSSKFNQAIHRVKELKIMLKAMVTILKEVEDDLYDAIENGSKKNG